MQQPRNLHSIYPNSRDQTGDFSDDWKEIFAEEYRDILGGSRDAGPNYEEPFSGKLVVVEDWPVNELHLGQVGGVATDPDGYLHIFHRADRMWDLRFAGRFIVETMFRVQNQRLRQLTRLFVYRLLLILANVYRTERQCPRTLYTAIEILMLTTLQVQGRHPALPGGMTRSQIGLPDECCLVTNARSTRPLSADIHKLLERQSDIDQLR